jgi:hypothetical protein
VSNLAQFVSNPGMPHWKALKHLLRYLKGSVDYEIVYTRCSPEQFGLFGFSDSDWASNSDDRRSVSGYCFSLSPSGGIVSWASRRQGCVALSSCEAEYVALSQAAQELVFLRGLLSDLGVVSEQPPVLFGDNQGAVALASNPIAHKRTKHIDVRHHFIRQLVEGKALSIQYVPTADNRSDVFTKNLPRPAYYVNLSFIAGVTV